MSVSSVFVCVCVWGGDGTVGAARLARDVIGEFYLHPSAQGSQQKKEDIAKHVMLARMLWSLMVFGESQASYTIRVMKQLGTTVGQKLCS